MFTSSNKAPARKKTRGQTIVEVTLILPFLIVLVGAALDWGLVFFVSHVVQNAVRSGARVAVTMNTPVSRTAVRTEVQRVMPNSALFSGFRNSATIQVSCIPPAGTTPPFIQVQTTGNFNFYFMRLFGLTTTTLTRNATMHYERAVICPAIV